MTTEPFALAPYATEYRFGWSGGRERARTVYITRYDNHHRLGTGWWVMTVLGAMNPWYMSAAGEWNYKSGSKWETAEEAYQALCRFGTSDLDEGERLAAASASGETTPESDG